MDIITKRAIIIVLSYHHMNTEKVARSIAAVLNAEVKRPQDITPEQLSGYALVGIGAGIDSGKHYKPILEFAEKLLPSEGQKAFIFSTAGVTGMQKTLNDHKTLRDILLSKGYDVVDEFGCKGFDTNSFLKFIGGIGKGRPNDEDLKNAADFARKLEQYLA